MRWAKLTCSLPAPASGCLVAVRFLSIRNSLCCTEPCLLGYTTEAPCRQELSFPWCVVWTPQCLVNSVCFLPVYCMTGGGQDHCACSLPPAEHWKQSSRPRAQGKLGSGSRTTWEVSPGKKQRSIVTIKSSQVRVLPGGWLWCLSFVCSGRDGATCPATTTGWMKHSC